MINTNNNEMKTAKDLNKQLTNKESGESYTYAINNTVYTIKANYIKGWYMETEVNGHYVDSYGYNGLTLKDCKSMILNNWNNGTIK